MLDHVPPVCPAHSTDFYRLRPSPVQGIPSRLRRSDREGEQKLFFRYCASSSVGRLSRVPEDCVYAVVADAEIAMRRVVLLLDQGVT